MIDPEIPEPERPRKGERGKRDGRGPLFTPRDIDNIRWFWRNYLKRSIPALFVVLGMILLQGVVYQQFLKLTEDGLRIIFEAGSFRDILWVCAFVFLLFTVRGATSYLIPRIATYLASNAVMRMRRDLIDQYLRLDLTFFERTRSGEIMLRLVGQAQGLSEFVGTQIMNAARDGATIIIVSAYLAWREPILFSAAVIFIPATVLIMHAVSNRIKQIQRDSQAATSAFMTTIDEMSHGMRTVKLSGQEPFERARLFRQTKIIRDKSIALQSAQALVLPSLDLVSAIVYMLVIGGGGYLALSPDYDTDGATIIAFLLGLVLIFDPARHLVQFFTRVQQKLIMLESVRDVFDLVPDIRDRDGAKDTIDAGADIRFDDVTFAYTPDHPLFRDLNLVFEGGKTTAIVGATGSGKTTVLSLLARLYEVQDGQVRVGDTDIRDIKVATLRGALSVVAQDVVIFDSSIFENIRYVKPGATDDEVWAAAEAAEIADLMRERGDATLGPKGAQLSGGQKQRIAIARAFLRNAPIVLLDEATSALDQRTEEKVKRALDRLTGNRTTIIVAHKLASVVDAARIYVLDRGVVVEDGDHASLIAQGGLYAAMYGAQKSSYT
jgi:ATP-binding cassette subfamily B protein/subfamily B ATP-binding cassette protein MsbA